MSTELEKLSSEVGDQTELGERRGLAGEQECAEPDHMPHAQLLDVLGHAMPGAPGLAGGSALVSRVPAVGTARICGGAARGCRCRLARVFGHVAAQP